MYERQKYALENGKDISGKSKHEIFKIPSFEKDKINDTIAINSGYSVVDASELNKARVVYLENYYKNDIEIKEKFIENFIIKDAFRDEKENIRIKMQVGIHTINLGLNPERRYYSVKSDDGISNDGYINNIMDRLFLLLPKEVQIEFSEMYYLESAKLSVFIFYINFIFVYFVAISYQYQH